ncbi:MAG: hypothetical protein WA190_02535 [Usitatibacter sp.]
MRRSAALLVALAIQPCLAESYGIREDEPHVGSSIRRNVVSWYIPLDRRWDEMTEEQKTSVKNFYEKIEPGDEPPFPAEGMRPVMDLVRKAQAKLLINEDVNIVVTVGIAGDVLTVKAVGTPDPDMTKFLAGVMYRTKFKPAVCGGKPCQMDFPFHFAFKIRD